ncbi:MAG TPA: RDD family protein [Polyangiaceae bacterium]|nr:RDD family protein [Polyangiaceae bacterium]
MPPARRDPIDTVTEVDTPERVQLRCRVAGPAQRGAAYALDLGVRAALLALCALGASLLDALNTDWRGLGSGVLLVVFFVLEWSYYVACELWMNGQSPGKRALGLRESLLRNLLRAADFVPNLYVLGLLVMCGDGKFRRIGDIVAGTMVISERGEGALPAIALLPPPTAEELSGLPARLLLSADELDALDLFMRRKEALSPARAAELAALVAPLLARRFGLAYADPVRFVGLLYHRATHWSSA